MKSRKLLPSRIVSTCTCGSFLLRLSPGSMRLGADAHHEPAPVGISVSSAFTHAGARTALYNSSGGVTCTAARTLGSAVCASICMTRSACARASAISQSAGHSTCVGNLSHSVESKRGMAGLCCISSARIPHDPARTKCELARVANIISSTLKAGGVSVSSRGRVAGSAGCRASVRQLISGRRSRAPKAVVSARGGYFALRTIVA